jgi:hypothetical protein
VTDHKAKSAKLEPSQANVPAAAESGDDASEEYMQHTSFSVLL